MSVSVIKSISTRVGDYTDNVKEVSTTSTTVAEMSDIVAAENTLNSKIKSTEARIQEEMNLLRQLVDRLYKENRSLKEILLENFNHHVEKEKEILYGIYQDISDKLSNHINND